MFFVKASDKNLRPPVALLFVQWLLLVVFLLNLWAIYLILREFRLLHLWQEHPRPASAQALSTLRWELGLRLTSRLIVTAVLIAATMILLHLRRRHLSIRLTLLRVKEQASNILESMDQGVIAVDVQGLIKYVNAAAGRILALDPKSDGRTLASISTPDLPLVELMDRITERVEPVQDQEFAVRRLGREQRFQVDAQVLKDPLGKRIGGVIWLRDVTERVLMEARLRRMERFLGLGTVASGLIHEIKNPLTALGIHVHLLEEHLAESDRTDELAELIEVLKTEVRRLNTVLDGFRDYAHLQCLMVQPIDPLTLLEEIVRLIRPQAEGQGVQVTMCPPETPMPRVPLDTEKIRRAVLNLVINALEAMPSGGELTLGVELRDQELRIEVSDTGPGIPPEFRDDVFKPYVTTKPRGSGLGLALAEKLVGQHHGHIDYQTSGEGTSFRLTIPLESGGEVSDDHD